MRCLWCRRGRLRLKPSGHRTDAAPAGETRPEASGRGEPCVLLVAPAASYRIPAYTAAARRLGVPLVVACEGRHVLIPDGVEGVAVAPGEAEGAILDVARGRDVAGVVATDDHTVELASRVATALGVPANSVEAARISRRKDLSREALRAAGAPTPWFRRLDLQGDLQAQAAGCRFPCVVKPLALSGSRGVIRADDPGALVQACRRVAGILRGVTHPDEGRYALVESFLPGFEVAVEGVLANGALRVLAVFDKPDPLDGPFFEETYYVTPSRLPGELQGRVADRLREACLAMGLREGPVHGELRVHQGDATVVEVAARSIGGDCARLLRFGAGSGLEELVLAHALGRDDASRPEDGGAGVLMIPTPRSGVLRRVEGVLDARRVPFVEDVEITVREGYELVPLPEGSRYLGFVFARAPSAVEAERALRQAQECLRIVTAPVWRLEPATA